MLLKAFYLPFSCVFATFEMGERPLNYKLEVCLISLYPLLILQMLNVLVRYQHTHLSTLSLYLFSLVVNAIFMNKTNFSSVQGRSDQA